jgi:CRP/FNR family cyclic AMP-dependent transcriptional regulator
MTEEKACRRFSHVDDVMAILNRISIFAGLNDAQLYTIFHELEEVSYAKGEFVFERGTEPSHIYIIVKGTVKLIVSEDDTLLELTEFSPGDCFGETAVIGIVPHEASAMAVGKVDLLVLSRKALLSFLKTDLAIFSLLILNIAREACRRLSKTDQILLHYVMQETHRK